MQGSSGHSRHCPASSRGSERKIAPMTVSSPNVIEIKLARLIDEMRFLKSHTIALDTRLRAIEAYLKPSEPSEQQPDSKFTPWLAAAASARSASLRCNADGSRGTAWPSLLKYAVPVCRLGRKNSVAGRRLSQAEAKRFAG